MPNKSLLVRRRDDEGLVLDAFDETGRFQRSIRTSELDRVTTHSVTYSALYGVRQGELDIPLVVRLHLQPPTPTPFRPCPVDSHFPPRCRPSLRRSSATASRI